MPNAASRGGKRSPIAQVPYRAEITYLAACVAL
jgi:hypothetical protein